MHCRCAKVYRNCATRNTYYANTLFPFSSLYAKYIQNLCFYNWKRHVSTTQQYFIVYLNVLMLVRVQSQSKCQHIDFFFLHVSKSCRLPILKMQISLVLLHWIHNAWKGVPRLQQWLLYVCLAKFGKHLWICNGKVLLIKFNHTKITWCFFPSF